MAKATVEKETDAVSRLTKDLIGAAKTLSEQEVRYLVDYYYLSQEDRKRAHNQERALNESEEPCAVIGWLADQSALLEKQIKRALDAYAKAHIMGDWLYDVTGIGPVISAGLLAHISLEPYRCRNAEAKKPCREESPCSPQCGRERIETVGHIWRYAGFDPTTTWAKGQKRPWNASLKTLCWKVGQSFMKLTGNDECFYGKIYLERKILDQNNNEAGKFADQAKVGAERVGKTTDAYVWYAGCLTAEAGRKIISADSTERPKLMKKYAGKPGSGVPMLPPAHIDARARRYAVKLFLAHFHAEWYQRRFGVPAPKPYAIAILGHAHEIRPQTRRSPKESIASL